ncbi:MAG: MgtC/SapB family protein [Candidatus Promineifilaceae bacterium]|nr:MgtC/SapB family protein [Candidatus Promineifilaceae bacterium]
MDTINASEAALFYRFGVALFIGILVGLQREHASEQIALPDRRTESFAGVRTFALFSLVGAAAALVADLLDSPWAFVGIILPLGVLIAVGYFITSWGSDAGMTTEVAALVTILAGALAYWDYLALAVALGVATTALLSLKLELHGFAARITREDLFAVLKFAVITAIVLPLLPDETFGPPPFDVFNPYEIWLLVVLISGISFLGYLLMKLVKPREGITLTGLLGGLASSTATTLSFAQRSQRNSALSRSFALAIMLAWIVMFGRALVEVATVNPALLDAVWLPLVVPAIAGLAYAAYLYFFAPRVTDEEEVTLTNPFELGMAVQFGLIFAVVLFISRAGQVYLGETGVYISSFVAGLADVDAVVLSLAELARQSGGPDVVTAARGVVIAALANTIAKGAIVFITGTPGLRRALLPGFLLIVVAGGAALFVI